VNRLVGIAARIISPTQTAFIPGRNILEGVVVLHETIHEIQRKKMSGVVLKLDFEKAYDKVNWDFLFQTLRMKGFQQNDTLGRYFQTKKGLRQGDPHLIEGGISILQYADDYLYSQELNWCSSRST
jgi:hypothetical protein